jgi:hypothetical protein
MADNIPLTTDQITYLKSLVPPPPDNNGLINYSEANQYLYEINKRAVGWAK